MHHPTPPSPTAADATALLTALAQPLPVLTTDEGAVIVTLAGVLELRRVGRTWWSWEGEDGRRVVVRAARA